MPTPFVYASPEQVVRDKADYARKNIARGRPVVAVEFADGIVLIAENPSTTRHKISEIYDRIAFAGVGKINEYENLRIAGIRQAELTGYSYSRSDVTAKNLATQFSQILGQIFTEAFKPFEVEILLAQVGELGEASELYHITFDGDMADASSYGAVGPQAEAIRTHLSGQFQPGLTLPAALQLGVSALRAAGDREIAAPALEVCVLDRNLGRRKFRRLQPGEIAAALEVS